MITTKSGVAEFRDEAGRMQIYEANEAGWSATATHSQAYPLTSVLEDLRIVAGDHAWW